MCYKAAALGASLAGAITPSLALANQYDFLAAPQINLSLVYRLDKLTGEYGLVATRHEQEGGVFRVDYRTGRLSICYLYFQREKQGDHEAVTDQYVVCAPQGE